MEETKELSSLNLGSNFELIGYNCFSKQPKKYQLADLPKVSKSTPNKNPVCSDSEDESIYSPNEKKTNSTYLAKNSQRIYTPEGNLFNFDFDKEHSFNIYMPHNNLKIVMSNFQTIIRKDELDWMSIRKVKAKTKETEKLNFPKKRFMRTKNYFKNNNNE